MAEHSAVNRRVVSSSLTCGANFYNSLAAVIATAAFLFPVIFPVIKDRPTLRQPNGFYHIETNRGLCPSIRLREIANHKVVDRWESSFGGDFPLLQREFADAAKFFQKLLGDSDGFLV